MDDQLTQLVELQREQNALLKRYLWRLRFSLLGLLLLTTATSIGLGLVIYQTRNAVTPVFPQTATPITYSPYVPYQSGSTTVEVPASSADDDLFGE